MGRSVVGAWSRSALHTPPSPFSNLLPRVVHPNRERVASTQPLFFMTVLPETFASVGVFAGRHSSRIFVSFQPFQQQVH